MTVTALRPVVDEPSPDLPLTREERNTRMTVRLLTAVLFFNVFLMRLAVPTGATAVPMLLPFLFAVVVIMRLRGDLVIDVGRTRAYLAAMTACSLAAFVSFARGHTDASFTSLLLLVTTYAPFCFGMRRDRDALFTTLLARFVTFTTVLAWLAIIQFGIQLVGIHYTDLIGSVVPKSFLLQNFNTSYPVQYGSPLYKANAWVCLEPSFCSQFLALGLVAHIVRGAQWRRVLLYMIAIIATVSGTGLILLAVVIGVLCLRRGPAFAGRVLMIGIIVIGALSFTPAAKPFEKRLTETSSSQSSGSLRFVQPYTRMYAALGRDPTTVLFGAGPGSADRDAAAFQIENGLPLNYGLIPKLVIEYGLLGAIFFLAFIISAFVRGTPSMEMSVAVIVFYVVLSSSLLSPVVGYLCLILVTWFLRDPNALDRGGDVTAATSIQRAVGGQ